jgi:TLD
MGNSNTSPALTPEQSDIKYLGSRFPFGDDELLKIYRIFFILDQRKERKSFLTEWAVECFVLPRIRTNEETNSFELNPEMSKLQRLNSMQVIEDNILPPRFSELLESTNFAVPENACHMEKLEHFFQGVSNLGRKGGRQAISVLFECYVNKDTSLGMGNITAKVADFRLILMSVYRLSLAGAYLRASQNGEDTNKWIPGKDIDYSAMNGLVLSMIEFVKTKRIRESPYGTVEHDPWLEKGFAEKLDIQDYVESNLPVMSSALSYFMFQVFFPEKPYPRSSTAFYFPKLNSDSAFFHDTASPLLFSFASLSASLGGTWHRLYTSSNDGLSFNRLLNSLLGYAGPTLIIIRAVNGGILGAFTASAWKESKDFYGTSDCFLYQLIPLTCVYRPTGNGRNFMYCNSEARSRGYDGQAHGIGFGGDAENPRLFISESFEECMARSQDLTFQHGTLLPKTKEGATCTSFDIDILEVWGVGGDEVVGEALGARSRQREITEAALRKARKVDKAAFLDDFRGGLIDSKAFAHRNQIQGRADVDLEERNSNNKYEYEK